jgi:hypothetical protein
MLDNNSTSPSEYSGDSEGQLLSNDHMLEGQDTFWRGATFLPLDKPLRSDVLLDRVWKSQQAAFLAFALNLSATQDELCKSTGIYDCLETFKTLTAETRRRLVQYPPFTSWLKLTLSADSTRRDRTEILSSLKRIMESFEADVRNRSVLKNGSSRVRLARFDVDPLIKKAASPDYRFPDRTRELEFEDSVAYPVSFFGDMVALALDRIRRAWPAAHQQFFSFVRLIVDMIDAEITSYSACDHMGAIFVSTDNSSLIALEEYLVHELGHQILYCVMELDPIVINEPNRVFRLPWSGRERDLYGYFHAFYVYTFLAHYLCRVERRSQREQNRVSDRVSHILKGLEKAAIELQAVDSFTMRGKHLFENLIASATFLAKHKQR